MKLCCLVTCSFVLATQRGSDVEQLWQHCDVTLTFQNCTMLRFTPWPWISCIFISFSCKKSLISIILLNIKCNYQDTWALSFNPWLYTHWSSGDTGHWWGELNPVCLGHWGKEFPVSAPGGWICSPRCWVLCRVLPSQVQKENRCVCIVSMETQRHS